MADAMPMPSPMMTAKPAGDGKATGSLVCGIIGLFVAGIILGIIAIVLAVQSKKEAQMAGQMQSGKAKAGLILGIVAIVVNVLFFVFWMTVFSAALGKAASGA